MLIVVVVFLVVFTNLWFEIRVTYVSHHPSRTPVIVSGCSETNFYFQEISRESVKSWVQEIVIEKKQEDRNGLIKYSEYNVFLMRMT